MPLTELVSLLQKERTGTTKQGVYAVVRKLKAQEVVVVHGKKASLNLLWLNRLEKFLEDARAALGESGGAADSFLGLRDGEKISYAFRDPVSADPFWGHALELLAAASKTDEPVYLYNPHDWFLLARRDSELASMRAIAAKGKRWCLTVAGNAPADRAIAKDFDGDQSQYHMAGKSPFPKADRYLNVIDDFIIEVAIDPAAASRLEQWYRDTAHVDEKAARRLQSIVSARSKTKLVISRNRRKAERLKRPLRKSFYLPKN